MTGFGIEHLIAWRELGGRMSLGDEALKRSRSQHLKSGEHIQHID